MARPLNKLSDLLLRSAKSAGRYSDGGGLYLSVSKSGTRSWIFMWVSRHWRREMGLGSYPAVTLASARQKAALCREQVAAGDDPIAERDRAPAPSFGECARRYIAAKTPEWTNEKHKYQWHQTLMGCPTVVLDKPVSDISGEDVLLILRPIWLVKSETASRLRGRVEKVLNFAKSEGWRAGENPAAWKGNLENKLPRRRKLSRGHHPAMPFDDVPEFMVELRGRESVAARALEFAILTAARSGEVLGSTWAEIDLDRAIWTVPAARMKGGVPHEVPLSARTINILKAMQANSIGRFIFPSIDPERPLSSMAMLMLLRRMGRSKLTVHGFRSSFRDWAGDTTEFSREVAEAALAHKVGKEVERAYRRATALEKRRRLMDEWAKFCCPKHVGSRHIVEEAHALQH